MSSFGLPFSHIPQILWALWKYAYWNIFSAPLQDPTKYFTTWERQNPSINVTECYKTSRFQVFKILKCSAGEGWCKIQPVGKYPFFICSPKKESNPTAKSREIGLTGSFPIFKPENPSIEKFGEVRKCRSTIFEASKLQKGRSGNAAAAAEKQTVQRTIIFSADQ